MRPLAVKCYLLAVLVAEAVAEQGSCPGGPASCNSGDEETALLQFARRPEVSHGVPQDYCNPHTHSNCTYPCQTVNVSTDDGWVPRCSGQPFDLSYMNIIFGDKVEDMSFPSTVDQGVEQSIFDKEYCGGMEQVRYARSTTDMVLYTGEPDKVNTSDLSHWNSFYTEAKWWVGEKTLSGLPGYNPFTTADYANEAAAIPFVPQTAIKCTFPPTEGFYIGSGAPRKTGADNPEDMCSEFNVTSGKGAAWQTGLIKQVQDPDDDQLQIYMLSKSNAAHLPTPKTCYVCDVSDTATPMWDQMSTCTSSQTWYQV